MPDCMHLKNLEYMDCLEPVTPYTQGPDPDDTPYPCGSCYVCKINEENVNLRARLIECKELANENGLYP